MHGRLSHYWGTTSEEVTFSMCFLETKYEYNLFILRSQGLEFNPHPFKHFSRDLLWNFRGTSHDILTTQKASLVTLCDYTTRVNEVPSVDL